MSRSQKSAYYSVFFSASWCPFSSNARPIFNTLSSMFPQIKHLAVEESSSMPRYVKSYCTHYICCIKVYMICFLSMKTVFAISSHMLCSVFSRYGIHSFPAILLANGTMMVRYRGSKDIDSLVNFYKKTTGGSLKLF